MNEEYREQHMEYLIDRLKLMYPFIYERAESFELESFHELLIFDKDGGRYRYDDVYDTFRYFKPGYDSDNRDAERIKRSFGFRLQRQMTLRGMGQAELAEAIGVSQKTISNYINRRQSPDVVKLILIARALRCSVDELLRD